MLWERLPSESATVTAVRDSRSDDEPAVDPAQMPEPGAGPWSATNLLLADIFDSLERLNFYFLSANSQAPPSRPKPMPRPGVKSKRRLTPEQRERLEAMRPRQEAR